MAGGNTVGGMARVACVAMRARFEVVIADGEQALGHAALEEVRATDAELSRFREDSAISALNRGASDWVVLPPQTFALLALCRRVWEESRGAFDPLARAAETGHFEPAQPSTGAQPNFGAVRFDAARCAVALPAATRIDLGGVGKGEALDRAASLLRTEGVASALLHGGGSSVLAIGSAPDDAPWRVALPAASGSDTVELRDRALALSSADGPLDRPDPEQQGHLLDPRTGRSVRSGSLAVALAPSAAEADAWSTAFAVGAPLPNAENRTSQLTAWTLPTDAIS